MRVRAISFDADQTLWDFHGVLAKALAATVDTMTDRELVPAGSVGPADLQAARDEIVGRSRGTPHSLEEVRRASFALVLDRAGHPNADAAAADLLEVFLDVRFNEIALYPEVSDSLTRLGKRFPLGLLSNGNTDPDRCGLAGVFDAVVMGPTFGFEKPDPRAFETIARRLGVAPQDVVHVGDDWDDIDGANRSGMRSVYINRTGDDPPFRSRADLEIRDLGELEQILER